MKYSTAEVAERIGVSKNTLLRWLYSGKIPEPRRQQVGGIEVRIWSVRDLTQAQKFKTANYCKGRGRKKRAQNKRPR